MYCTTVVQCAEIFWEVQCYQCCRSGRDECRQWPITVTFKGPSKPLLFLLFINLKPKTALRTAKTILIFSYTHIRIYSYMNSQCNTHIWAAEALNVLITFEITFLSKKSVYFSKEFSLHWFDLQVWLSVKSIVTIPVMLIYLFISTTQRVKISNIYFNLKLFLPHS